MRLPPVQEQLSLPELAGMFREAFLPDLTIENEYVCKLFYRQLNGYVRFNYANRQEVAVMYEEDVRSVIQKQRATRSGNHSCCSLLYFSLRESMMYTHPISPHKTNPNECSAP